MYKNLFVLKLKTKNKQGFTLIELLAVIVIIAVIAVITIPMIMNIINETKKNSTMRSAEMYIHSVEQSVISKNITDQENFVPDKCEVQSDGNLLCGEHLLNVDTKGERPKEGIIFFSNGEVEEIQNLKFSTLYVNVDEEGKISTSDSETKFLINSLEIIYDNCKDKQICTPNVEIKPKNATNKNLEFTTDNKYYNCGKSYSNSGVLTIDGSTGIITKHLGILEKHI